MIEVEHNQTKARIIELKWSVSIHVFNVQSTGKLTSWTIVKFAPTLLGKER